MLVRSTIVAIASLALAAPALAAADMTVSITNPAAAYVYNNTSYSIVVSNTGNKTASSVSLSIQLPVTHTSPTVYVMGTTSSVDSRCTASGTRLICALGSMSRSTSKTVTFNIALPESSDTLSVSAAVTTTSAETSTSNNSASNSPTLVNRVVTVGVGAGAHNTHCTGTNLTSFFECELFPSSESSHDVIFDTATTLTIPAEPGYSGTWSQPTSDSLTFSYYYGADLVATFVGYGTSTIASGGADCFEGITTFPSSVYVSPYEVCLY